MPIEETETFYMYIIIKKNYEQKQKQTIEIKSDQTRRPL